MPVYIHKPDNVLKRAQEFIDVGKDDRALEALSGLIKNQPHKIWQKTPGEVSYEFFSKFLELCVKLRKSDVAKEGLYHYRNICQQVNVNALETVFRNFLKNAEERTSQAAKESKENMNEVEDLDVIQSPEELLLSAVSGEDSQDRTNRMVLTPWVKFLWEAYRQCLELLRNNNLVQRLYHYIANQAFLFCQKYQRRTEFKKLSENLRYHLVLLQKQNNPSVAIDLNNPETQQMHLNTRFNQLNIAIEMELWHEAFKIVQDIYGLMQISTNQVKAPVRASYYKKLALVFWCAENNHLYHACALHRLYNLYCDNKRNFTVDEEQKMCTSILLATLSIPIPPAKSYIDRFYDHNDKNRKLAALLGLATPPTRHSLIKDLIKYNIVSKVPAELKQLFDWLEVDFHPLKLSSRVAHCLTYITENEPKLVKYIPSLQSVTLFKLLQQISQVYSTIKFERLCSIINFLTPEEVERYIVNVAKNNDIQVRMDHKTGMLCMGRDMSVMNDYLSPDAEHELCDEGLVDGVKHYLYSTHLASLLANRNIAFASGENKNEGRNVISAVTQLQPLPTQCVRLQFVALATQINCILDEIKPTSLQKSVESEQLMLVKQYQDMAASEFEKVSQRLEDIDNRRKKLEDMQKDLIKEARQKQLKQEEQDAARREWEQSAAARDKAQYLKFQEAVAKRKQAEVLQNNSAAGKTNANVVVGLANLVVAPSAAPGTFSNATGAISAANAGGALSLSSGGLVKKEGDISEDKRNQNKNQELATKLKTQFKRVDHLARAIHSEKMEKLTALTHKLMDERREEWNALEAKRLEAEKKAIIFGAQEKSRLSRIKSDFLNVVSELKQLHQADYEKSVVDFQDLLVRERESRLAQRAADRKHERRARYEAKQSAQEKKKDEKLLATTTKKEQPVYGVIAPTEPQGSAVVPPRSSWYSASAAGQKDEMDSALRHRDGSTGQQPASGNKWYSGTGGNTMRRDERTSYNSANPMSNTSNMPSGKSNNAYVPPSRRFESSGGGGGTTTAQSNKSSNGPGGWYNRNNTTNNNPNPRVENASGRQPFNTNRYNNNNSQTINSMKQNANYQRRNVNNDVDDENVETAVGGGWRVSQSTGGNRQRTGNNNYQSYNNNNNNNNYSRPTYNN